MAESTEAHLEEIRDTAESLRPDLEAWERGDATLLPTVTLALYVPDVEFLIAQLDRQREALTAANVLAVVVNAYPPETLAKAGMTVAEYQDVAEAYGNLRAALAKLEAGE